MTKLEVTCATADQDGLVKDVKMRSENATWILAKMKQNVLTCSKTFSASVQKEPMERAVKTHQIVVLVILVSTAVSATMLDPI